MVVRITRLLLLLQLIAGAGIFLLFTTFLPIGNVSAALMSVLAVALVRMLITGNNFLLAAPFCSETPPHYRIGIWQSCSLFAGEFRATMLSSSWTMPFRRFGTRMAEHPQGLPVLLVHGYGCNSGYWHSMSQALLNAHITHHAIDLEPITCGIDEYAPLIHDAVERLCRDTGKDKVVIVAHSMGGLAARAYLRRHGSSRIAKVITLGTPHRGTALARFGLGLNTQQMRWTASEQEGLASDWLRELVAGEDEELYRLFVSVYSHHDNIISPQTSSHLHGAKNIELRGIGHVALGLHPTVQAIVISEVRDASRTQLSTDHSTMQAVRFRGE